MTESPFSGSVSSQGLTAILPTKRYTIGQLSREFGVSLRTLRFYEDKGLISPIRDGMSRYYTPNCKARLAVILKAKTLGFTLVEIREMLAEKEASGEQPSLNLSPKQVEEQIAQLTQQKTEIEAALTELYAARERMAAKAA